MTNPQAQRATWSYDAASRVTGIHFANTTRASYSYDNANRLLRVANLSSTSTTLSSFSYALDAVGNRLRVVESTGNRVTWSYDNTYQLRNEQRSGSNSYNITYTYDPVGNRLDRDQRRGSHDEYLRRRQRADENPGSRRHDDDHLRRERKPTAEPEPIEPADIVHLGLREPPHPGGAANGVPNTFTYNGDGQRVQKQDSTGTTKHVWDNQNVLLETDGSNIIQVVYTMEPDALWQPDLATPERDYLVLPVRRAGINDTTVE